MDNNTIIALATVLLVIVGVAQVVILIAQRRQSQLEPVELYRKAWREIRKNWGTVVFIGRNEDDNRQVLDEGAVKDLVPLVDKANSHALQLWLLNSKILVFTLRSDICAKLLRGRLDIGDVHPLFGTELLRHGRPLVNHSHFRASC